MRVAAWWRRWFGRGRSDAGSRSDSGSDSDSGSGSDSRSDSGSVSGSVSDSVSGSDSDARSDSDSPDAIIALPITSVLDLHTFAPRDVASVVTEYLHAARAAGLHHVRVIHGKGKGVQRDIVHRVLRAHPAVAHFALAPADAGGWGATLVTLAA